MKLAAARADVDFIEQTNRDEMARLLLVLKEAEASLMELL
jgi:hypothetical protein